MKVLIVEDSDINRKLICKMLKGLGYEILEAADGDIALEMVHQHRPDLILMDYHIPGRNGIELTAEIKQNPLLQYIPIVAITADIYSQAQFEEAGCDSFMRKPVRRRKLVRTIAKAFNSRVAL